MVSQWFHYNQFPHFKDVSLSQFVRVFLAEKGESGAVVSAVVVVVVVADVVWSLLCM